VASGIAIWVYRHSSQEVCPWNVRFARELPADSPFKPREALAGKDARPLARELLQMTREDFSVAFKISPMKLAKLRGLKRNAAVVLGNVGAVQDTDVLRHALGDPEPLAREHAAWTLNLLAARADSVED
jgi:epoxyqueuosine reductase